MGSKRQNQSQRFLYSADETALSRNGGDAAYLSSVYHFVPAKPAE